MRKAAELNISNIEFAQADILNAGEIDREFDVIESSGVLHHMVDAEVGLKCLLNCLKPGGFIKLALYSELARQDIVELRKRSEGNVPDVSAKGIRDFRRNLQESDPELYGRLAKWNDLHTTSMLRDLLFHVKEHRFTIPQLIAMLDRCGLEFLGFSFGNRNEKAGYLSDFPDDWKCTNLDNWHVFEQKNPSTFRKMYQFWCRKPA